MTCDKIVYETYKLAIDAVIQIGKSGKRGKKEMRPYKCPDCGNFHLATMNKRTLFTRPKENKYPIKMEELPKAKKKNVKVRKQPKEKLRTIGNPILATEKLGNYFPNKRSK